MNKIIFIPRFKKRKPFAFSFDFDKLNSNFVNLSVSLNQNLII